jgi:hypothetical protein
MPLLSPSYSKRKPPNLKIYWNGNELVLRGEWRISIAKKFISTRTATREQVKIARRGKGEVKSGRSEIAQIISLSINYKYEFLQESA